MAVQIALGIWVFQGEKSAFANGVFSSLEVAEAVIRKHQLSGILTRYEVDSLVWDWVQTNDFWKPKEDRHFTPEFKQRFSSAYSKHHHFVNGANQSERSESKNADSAD